MSKQFFKNTLFLTFSIVLMLGSNPTFADYAVVVPKHSPSVDEIANQIATALLDHKGVVLDKAEFKLANKGQFNLIVTIGKDVLEAVNSDPTLNEIPVLSAFSPRQSFELRDHRAAIFNDINLSIQIKLIKKLLPKTTPRIGIFYPQNSVFFQEQINYVSHTEGIVLIPSGLAKSDNSAKMITNFINKNDLDAFIFIPSGEIYDPHSLAAIFYALYRNEVAAIVYSPKLVKNGVGGAAAATFDKKIVTQTIIDEVNSFYKLGRFRSPFFIPRTANIVVNRKLSRSIQLDISAFTNESQIHE